MYSIKKAVLKNFQNFHRRTTVVECLFNKVAGLKAVSILHLLIIFTQKLSRKKFYIGRKI